MQPLHAPGNDRTHFLGAQSDDEVDTTQVDLVHKLGTLSRDDAEAWTAFLQATALMFVAFTGYARIATLGEEMRDPTRNIPRAIVVTLIVSSLVYIAVGAAGIGTVGADRLAEAAATEVAPLVVAAKTSSMCPSHTGSSASAR